MKNDDTRIVVAATLLRVMLLHVFVLVCAFALARQCISHLVLENADLTILSYEWGGALMSCHPAENMLQSSRVCQGSAENHVL